MKYWYLTGQCWIPIEGVDVPWHIKKLPFQIVFNENDKLTQESPNIVADYKQNGVWMGKRNKELQRLEVRLYPPKIDYRTTVATTNLRAVFKEGEFQGSGITELYKVMDQNQTTIKKKLQELQIHEYMLQDGLDRKYMNSQVQPVRKFLSTKDYKLGDPVDLLYKKRNVERYSDILFKPTVLLLHSKFISKPNQFLYIRNVLPDRLTDIILKKKIDKKYATEIENILIPLCRAFTYSEDEIEKYKTMDIRRTSLMIEGRWNDQMSDTSRILNMRRNFEPMDKFNFEIKSRLSLNYSGIIYNYDEIYYPELYKITALPSTSYLYYKSGLLRGNANTLIIKADKIFYFNFGETLTRFHYIDLHEIDLPTDEDYDIYMIKGKRSIKYNEDKRYFYPLLFKQRNRYLGRSIKLERKNDITLSQKISIMIIHKNVFLGDKVVYDTIKNLGSYNGTTRTKFISQIMI